MSRGMRFVISWKGRKGLGREDWEIWLRSEGLFHFLLGEESGKEKGKDLKVENWKIKGVEKCNYWDSTLSFRKRSDREKKGEVLI
jgi:hypothetical protein